MEKMKRSLRIVLGVTLTGLSFVANAPFAIAESINAKAAVVCGAARSWSNNEADLKRLYEIAKDDLESKTLKEGGFEVWGAQRTGNPNDPIRFRRGRMIPFYDFSEILYYKSEAPLPGAFPAPTSAGSSSDSVSDDGFVTAFACVSVFKRDTL